MTAVTQGHPIADLSTVDGLDTLSRDRGLLWHPYAPLDGTPPYAVLAADGTRLKVEAFDGATFEAVDAMSSWWSVVHGYRNPVLDHAIREQVDEFSHVMFGGLTHHPAVRLGERLVEMSGGVTPHVFFADSGSVSMEVALKLAVQYQVAKGRPRRSRFLALAGGYHGDTLGAMSVCDPVGGMHSAFPGLVPEHLFLPRPPAGRLLDPSSDTGDSAGESASTHVGDVPSAAGRVMSSDADEVAQWIDRLERTVAEHSDELAALVCEPVLQGAGGMYAWAPECLAAMGRVAGEHGLLLLLDEIATGFGRTGRLFAAEWADARPDIRCVGKALTGGYLTLAAVMCSREVGRVITHSEHRALLHGPTFMANPLACAAAAASVDLVQQNWQRQVADLENGLFTALAPACDLAAVREVRVLGGVGVVELHDPVDVPAVTRAALEHGVWVRPFRHCVYSMPPYVSTAEDVARIGAGIVAAVTEVHEPRMHDRARRDLGRVDS